MTTVVVDFGTTVIGLCNAGDGKYICFRWPKMQDAIPFLQEADEVVTYCGRNYDLEKLGKVIGLDDDLPLKGTHTDMAIVIWGDWRLYPQKLKETYLRHFPTLPVFPETPDEYVADNQGDVYMTHKLWELWKKGELKIIGGHEL